MNQAIFDKMTKARTQLLLKYPFFGSIALRLDMKEDPECLTMWTDGKSLGYSPDFVEKLEQEEVRGVIGHEVLHVVSLHFLREGDRDHYTWNMAGDYAVNYLLEESGLRLPPSRLRSARFDGMNAEAIYPKLVRDREEENGSSGQGPQGKDKGPGGVGGPGGGPEKKDDWSRVIGEVRKPTDTNGNPLSPAEEKEAEAEIKVAIKQAAMVAKKAGKLPGGLERLIDEIAEAKINWKEALSRFLTERIRDDYSWRSPNPRYVQRGFYLPCLQSESIGEVVFAVDTSGSIRQNEINEMGAEIQGVLGTWDRDFTVVYADARVQGEQEISRYDFPLNLKPVGGGGTKYAPTFDHIGKMDKMPICIIYLTDGVCHDFGTEPGCQVLWVLTTKPTNWDPPFGETITLN